MGISMCPDVQSPVLLVSDGFNRLGRTFFYLGKLEDIMIKCLEKGRLGMGGEYIYLYSGWSKNS